MLSVVAICKNEEDNIIPFVNSWSAVADEIVICDTGSEDGSKLVLMGLMLSTLENNVRVNYHNFGWDGNFSSARNYACNQAKGDQILWADMDDRIDTNSIERIKEIKKVLYVPHRFQIASDVGNGCYQRFMQTRIFPSWCRFVGEIHEKVDTGGLLVLDEPEVIIVHLGYADEEAKKKKAVRNLEILLKDGIPKDVEKLIYIGDALYVLGKFFVGLGYYEEAARLGGRIVEEQIADKLVAGYIAVGALEHKVNHALNLMPRLSVKRAYWSGEWKLAMGQIRPAREEYNAAIYGDRDLGGRIDDSDLMIANAKTRLETVCSLA